MVSEEETNSFRDSSEEGSDMTLETSGESQSAWKLFNLIFEKPFPIASILLLENKPRSRVSEKKGEIEIRFNVIYRFNLVGSFYELWPLPLAINRNPFSFFF